MFDRAMLEANGIRPISRKEYDQMVEANVFGEDDRLELVEGVLVAMSRQTWHHAAIVEALSNDLTRAVDRAYRVRTQLPFVAGDFSEPEPDIVTVRHEPKRREHPDKALLIIEVANESLRYDRTTKLEVYAKSGVPEYWIVDCKAMAVEVYTQPSGKRYKRKRVLHDGDTLKPTKLPGIAIAVADLPR
jgi:Uma2 family endonuclease